MKKNTLLLFFPILIVVAILLPASLTPNLFIFKSFGWNEVGQLLTFLLLISLFLERSLEVFITTWRTPQGEKLDDSVQACERRIAELETQITKQSPGSVSYNDLQDRLSEGLSELERLNLGRTEYKSQTRKIALWTALFIGLLVSGVGIRSLETLVDLREFIPDQKPIFYTGQVCIFRILDTLLTGGLIAGGSDGIHKLTQVFTVFLEETRNRMNDKPNNVSSQVAVQPSNNP